MDGALKDLCKVAEGAALDIQRRPDGLEVNLSTQAAAILERKRLTRPKAARTVGARGVDYPRHQVDSGQCRWRKRYAVESIIRQRGKDEDRSVLKGTGENIVFL